MNKLYTLLLSVLLISNYSFSQNSSAEPQNVVVNWKVGTTKTITHVDSTVVYSNDTILMATGISTNYKIKIISLKDTVYEISFKQINTNNIQIESDVIDASPIERMIQELITELQKEMTNFQYSLLVDQNSALAFEVKNQRELEKKMEDMVGISLDKYIDLAKIKLDASEKKEIQQKVKIRLTEIMPAVLETMLNSFNYIFQAYSFPFVIDEIYSTNVEVSDVDQIQFSGKENNAELVVKSSIKDSELTIDYKYVYDKEAAYQEYVVEKGTADQISRDQFDVDERVISKFDMNTSWIKSSSSFVKVIMGKVIVNTTSHVKIK